MLVLEKGTKSFEFKLSGIYVYLSYKKELSFHLFIDLCDAFLMWCINVEDFRFLY